MSKKRILILSQPIHPIPPTTGAAVEQWIDAVAHHCHDFDSTILSPPHPRRPDTESHFSVSYHRIRIGKIYARFFQKITRLDPYPYIDRVIAYVKKINPDLIHLHNTPYYVDAIKRKLPETPLILHMHNEKKVSFTSQLNCLAGCSQYIVDWFAHQKTPSQRFMAIPNGVDIAHFYPIPERKESLQARFGIPKNRFVILFVGRISPEKGPDTLIEAFSHLPQDQFHLVLAGEWAKGDPNKSDRVKYGNQLKEQMKHLNVTSLGAFSPEEMPDIYRLGDMLMIPSRFEEPFSMAAIEAMASGLPVLAFHRGGMVEYMKDGINARLISPTQEGKALANALQSFSEDPLGASERAINARQMVCDRFSWQAVADATSFMYRTVLEAAQ